MNKKSDNQQIEELKKQSEEWRIKYLRALADYQNLEKRIATERKEDIKFAGRSILLKLITVLDTLEKVEETLNDQGLKLTLKQLQEVLKQEGVEPLFAIGKKFDPHTMECIEVIECEKDDEVLEEYQRGYMMHNKLLRVAKVKAGKNKSDNIEHKI